MAYICKKNGKFYVYDLEEEPDMEELRKYFDFVITDIDILIASSIALLNEKGYTTEASCAEHYHSFLRCEETYYEQDIPPNAVYSKTDGNGEIKYCYIDHCDIQRSYVEFCDRYDFSTLPLGWNFSKGCFLYYKYDSNLNEYDFYKKQAEALGNLYDWVISLPNKK